MIGEYHGLAGWLEVKSKTLIQWRLTMQERHPLDVLAEANMVQAGDPSECPESMVEDCLSSGKWTFDYDAWQAGEGNITATLKDEHKPAIELWPTDVVISVYVSVDYYILANHTSVCVIFDFEQGGNVVSPDHGFESVGKDKYLNENEVMALVQHEIDVFKKQLIRGLEVHNVRN